MRERHSIEMTRPGDNRAGRVRHGVDEAPVPDAGSTSKRFQAKWVLVRVKKTRQTKINSVNNRRWHQ
jgi:hypothetical protein